MNKLTASRKMLLFSGILIVLIAVFVIAMNSGKQAESYAIEITAPSDENGPVTPGHSFFITGKITSTAEVPQDAVLRVSLFDENGTELRFAQCEEKDQNKVDKYCDALFYYADDVNPDRDEIVAEFHPYLIVSDVEHPQDSLRNANIKCWYSDSDFNSFIPCATDEAHGLIMDDGVGYTDAQGNPYDALSEGKYKAVVVLKDAKGNQLAQASKEFAIKAAEKAILCRFHPDEHYQNMMKFAEENNFSMNIDYLPGYLRDVTGNDKGGMRAMFIGGDCAVYKGSHTYMFEYLAAENSSSLTIELPYIEKYYDIDDPNLFTLYYYDIGEPSVNVNGQTIVGNPVMADTNDHLYMCRADIVSDVQEGYLDMSDFEPSDTDTDFSDGITLRTTEEGNLAFSGLVTPYQLEDDEIVFNPLKNETGLLNGIKTIQYYVWDGSELKQYQKGVTLTRKFANNEEYGSVMEFYHVFATDEIDPTGDYEVLMYGLDKDGQIVDGTKETFTINTDPEGSVEEAVASAVV